MFNIVNIIMNKVKKRKISVSIIMPYGINRPYFGFALRSAILQDFSKRKYEIIVVNDGVKSFNKEAMYNILKGYDKKKLPPVTYHDVSFSSLSSSVNYGIEKSIGKYYTVLPDDDIFLSNKLPLLFNELEKGEFSAVYSLPKRIDAKGDRLSDPRRVIDWAHAHPVVTWSHIEKGHGLMINGISTMYKKSASDLVGGWDEKLLRAEEWEFHLRLLKNGYNFKLVDDYTIEYRVHGNNKSKRRGAAERKAQMKYIYSKLKINKGE
tara:strand:+ start:81901 stop:82692 length:792 start_codon:yes stop_codon:yes gene_type:complete